MAGARDLNALSRRERQVLDILLRRGSCTAAEVLRDLPDPPTDSAVRSILRILVKKQYATYREEGGRYVYSPGIHPEKARQDAVSRLIHTFFGGSAANAMAALLSYSSRGLSDDEVDQLREKIEEARKDGR